MSDQDERHQTRAIRIRTAKFSLEDVANMQRQHADAAPPETEVKPDPEPPTT